jgi:signal transduction histidine kinase
MRRWYRSLYAQLFLWAILPVTFAIVAVAFTGIYGHQQTMRDFVAERDLDLVRLGGRIIEDGLAHGTVASDGAGLAEWFAGMLREDVLDLMVVDSQGRVLAHPDEELVGADLHADLGVAAALEQSEGSIIIPDKDEELVLVAFAPLEVVDWVVIVSEPVEGLIGPILRFPTLAPIAAGAAGLISLLVLAFGWLTIMRPLQRLAKAADQVSWGDYSAISRPAAGVQEVRDLHQSLAQMVERIQGYQSGMQDYLGAVTLGQEAERARLAHELHDGPVQDLIALGQQAERAQRLLDQGQPTEARELLDESRRAEVATVEGLRRIIGDLRPIYLEDLGVVPAMKMLASQAQRRTGANVKFDTSGELRRFHPETELAAYRIAQEALSNAVKHSGAQTIDMLVVSEPSGLTVSVTDDGTGFVFPEKANELTSSGHYGLVGMKERASRLGGSVDIQTAQHEGTRVIAHLPYRPSST